MHIPDGFLDTKTWVTTAAFSAVALGVSSTKTAEYLNDRQLPSLGIMSAFIFAAQMVNFPIAGGTSGHLLGAALATTLLGPWAASLIISTVLIIQCLFFQDGGLTALGANIFNMAVGGVLVAYLVQTLLSKLRLNQYVTSFVAAWASVMTAALLASVELSLSGTINFNVVYPAMAGVHALIGVGEGIITAVVVAFVLGTQKSAPKAEVSAR